MYAEVIVDISNVNVDKVFDYRIPDSLNIESGMRVQVPFGNRNQEGFVIAVKDNCDIEKTKIKDIITTLEDYPALTKEQLILAQDIKDKFKTTLTQSLRLMIPTQMRGSRVSEKFDRLVYLTEDKNLLKDYIHKITKNDGTSKYPKQKEIIDALLKNDTGLKACDFSSSAIKTLKKHGIIYFKDEQSFRLPFSDEITSETAPVLTSDQIRVLETINKEDNGKFLLHGVTGSGKTEIYVRIIQEALNNNKTAILLVPEISLTAQTYMALKQRIKEEVAVFHSGLSAGERFDEWKRVRLGKAKVVLGARSAIFAPIQNIGVIIIDEEHETSYKSDSFPPYNTIEIAEFRANYNNAKLVLGSATPSIATRFKAHNNEYTYLKMPYRISGHLPEISIIDMRKELMNGNRTIISADLYNAIKEALDNSKQVMLFLNRRGYSTFEMCRACGAVIKCSACDISMTYHKNENLLKCHYCGRTAQPSNTCPECGMPFLKLFGTGTQQVEEQVKNMFPKAKVLRMDADTMNTKHSYYNAYKTFDKGDADILIGTQMITQGFNFDNVVVSAVLAADTMLNLPDYRSAEESFRQMVQAAGRSGRKEAGKVFIQTYQPDNYAVQYAKDHDYDGFFKHESALRKLNKLPPYSRFVKIQFLGDNEDKVISAVKDCIVQLKTILIPKKRDIINITAAESSVKKVNNKFRYHILVNINPDNNDILDEIRTLISNLNYKDVLVGVDVNPNGYM